MRETGAALFADLFAQEPAYYQKFPQLFDPFAAVFRDVSPAVRWDASRTGRLTRTASHAQSRSSPPAPPSTDAAGNHALCYRVGDVDGSGGGEEKRIPVASITAVEIDNEMRYAPRNSGAILAQFWRNSAQFGHPPSTRCSYEWSVDATVRDAKYAFRCDTHDEMTRWVDGLRMLMM